MEFFDALKKLAEDKNIVLDIKEERSGIDYSSLREAMRTVANFYVAEYRKLPVDHPARQEVRRRGLSEKKMLYGYSPEGRQTLYKHLKAKGFSDEIILLTGACVRYEGKEAVFDFWNGRLMFFFTDITGKPLGWSGRKLYETDTRGKYVNSKEGVLFDKSAVLYNIAQAKKKAADDKLIHVCEGQFDVAAFVEADLTNSVAASGTAFTERQAQILRRLVGEDGKIVFCFDGDAAGIKAAEGVFRRIPLIHGQAWAVALPEGEDPDSYRQDNGNEALVTYLEEHRVPLLEFVLDNTATHFDLASDIERSQYVAQAARILRTISSNVLRDTYTKKVSLDSFTSIEVVRRAIDAAEPLTSEERTPEAVEAPAAAEEEPQKLETSELTLEDLKTLVRTNETYQVAARALALALSESTLVDTLTERRDLLPPEFQSVAAELQEKAEAGRLIPEMFTESDLVEYLTTTQFFRFSHLMESHQTAAQMVYLLNRLERLQREHKERRVRSKVAGVLQRSPNQGADFLEKALEAEERGLREVGVSQ